MAALGHHTVVYSAELSISSNDHISLATWQMQLSRAVLFVTRDPLKSFKELGLNVDKEIKNDREQCK